jgi:hypothetical protein
VERMEDLASGTFYFFRATAYDNFSLKLRKTISTGETKLCP